MDDNMSLGEACRIVAEGTRSFIEKPDPRAPIKLPWVMVIRAQGFIDGYNAAIEQFVERGSRR